MSEIEPDAPDGPTAAPAESARPPASETHPEEEPTPMLDIHPALLAHLLTSLGHSGRNDEQPHSKSEDCFHPEAAC
jgi:hypothetical protein